MIGKKLKEQQPTLYPFEFEKKDDIAQMSILIPFTYTNSAYFNSFDKKSILGSKRFIINVDKVKIFDTFAFIFIKDIKNLCTENNIDFELYGATDEFNKFISFLSNKEIQELKKTRISFLYNFFSEIGDNVKNTLHEFIKFIEFFGETCKKLFLLPVNLKKVRWDDFPNYLIKVGVNSIAICLVIVFFIGIIIGYVGAIQLARFGVGSFLAALVGIAITRELSPLMVGIIIAGRTGSSFAAEIGTMKVSEEVDALTSFGFDRQYFIVIPRLLATVISIPVLVSICNIVGIIGGYFAGAVVLDLTFSEFQVQLLDSTLRYIDVLGGIGKSIIFGFITSIVGCFKGFQVTGGAESVGKFTTSSVVVSIFLIIFIDAIFAFII